MEMNYGSRRQRRRALVSVTNKDRLEKLVPLVRVGWEFVSTGGTLKTLQNLGIPAIPIEQITGFPEMMDGRLKTIHPMIAGGILADRTKPEHLNKAMEYGIDLIDLVIVNLYAFGEKPGIENIDIGGPSLLRAAAKNFASVTVVVHPGDYDMVIAQIMEDGHTALETRRYLAQKVFRHTSAYDADIEAWFEQEKRHAFHKEPAPTA